MSTQNYTLIQFADLLARETQRGIIDGSAIMSAIGSAGIPTTIFDRYGDMRMEVEKDGDDLRVTRHMTPMAEESLLQIR